MRMRAFRWTVLTAIAISSLVVACDLGDDLLFPPTPGFGGTGAFFDAGSRSNPKSACDDITEGARCFASQATACEAKEHANLACNSVMRCSASAWRRTPPERDECAAECPSAYVAERPDACAFPNAGTLVCEYPEGTCGCAPVRPVKPDAGDGADGGDDSTDAGETDAGEADAGPVVYEWRCVTPEAGCPRTRPAVGTECVRPMSCDYGDCVFEDGVRMRCYSGDWATEKRCDR